MFNTITYDANGGTLSTTKIQQFYTGTPYKTPENSKSFSGTSTDDCEDLGYYNYSFGNKLTISIKIRLIPQMIPCLKNHKSFFVIMNGEVLV